ncbi:MAG: hypothetical protein KDA51_03900 [Planctomycetales bacterium]|nr:hypothetical protein [Planctomycetales bacterium]
MSDKRTITLTGRPPVRISDDNWPTLASASDKDWDNEYEFQANRITKWFIGVRQHRDGRAIVYATYSYSTNWQGERDASKKCGQMLDAGSSIDDIIRAIEYVCDDMGAGGDGKWDELKAECIADLPAVELE